MAPGMEEEHERTFNQADLDSDGKLTKAEGEEWFKLNCVAGGSEYDDNMKAIWNKLSNAICVLDATTADQFEFKDWERTK